jgi:hypothetical protein
LGPNYDIRVVFDLATSFLNLFNVRKKEHESKVRLTKEDMRNGRIAVAEERMGKEDGGLERHSIECTEEIDWEHTRI